MDRKSNDQLKREQKRAEGLIECRGLWLHPQDLYKLKLYAIKLEKAREQGIELMDTDILNGTSNSTI